MLNIRAAQLRSRSLTASAVELVSDLLQHCSSLIKQKRSFALVQTSLTASAIGLSTVLARDKKNLKKSIKIFGVKPLYHYLCCVLKL